MVQKFDIMYVQILRDIFLKMTVLHKIVVIEYQYNKELMSMYKMS